MIRFITLTGCIVFCCFFQALNSNAQAYTEYSLQDTISPAGAGLIKVVNGEAYVVSSPSYAGSSVKLEKHSADGSILYSSLIPLDQWVGVRAMEVINGEVYLLAAKPLGTWCCGITIQALKVSADGTLIFNRIISDTTSTNLFNPDNEIYPKIIINGNEWIIASWVTGLNFPTTMGALNVNDYNLFLLKLNATNGDIIRSLGIAGLLFPLNFNQSNKIVVENGFIYTAFTAYSSDLPVTIGGSPGQTSPGSGHVYVRKINLSNFNTVFARYISVDSTSRLGDFAVKNGEYHIAGTFSNRTSFYTRLNSNGTLAQTKHISTPSYWWNPICIKLSSNHAYIAGTAGNTQYSLLIYKLDFNGSVVYSKNSPINQYWSFDKWPVELVGDDLIIGGYGAAANYPVTNGSNYAGSQTSFITRYDPLGNMLFSTFVNPFSKMEVQDNKIFLIGQTEVAVNRSTDGSSINGSSDLCLTVLETEGNILYNGYFGGNQDDYVLDAAIQGGNVFITGGTASPDFPTTVPATLHNALYGDAFLTKISFCPNRYNTSADTISPVQQTACKYGLAQIISGNDILVHGDSLPLIYVNGVQTLQRPVQDIRYQWQRALSAAGPWVDIPGANDKDYRPIIGGVSEFFRRQSFLSAQCNAVLIHTSNTALVEVSAHTAPTANFESPLVTCPSSPVLLNAAAAVSGGQPPYNFSWDMGLPSVPSPTVSPNVNTVYTLMLTDAVGCQQLAQVVVTVYRANAGQDKSSCAGQPVRIGTAPLPGSNVSYTWMPAVGLNSNNIAQPMANPLAVTDYHLTVSLQKADGTNCVMQDSVRVKPVAPPADPNFAGPDKVACYPELVLVGTSPEAGFSYSWSPSTYITRVDTAQTFFDTDIVNEQLPSPNPASLYAYASKQGCVFSDTVIVSTIEANAGEPLCSSGVIGMPDRTPQIQETYAWTLTSGPGNFLGPTDLPQVPVSASIQGTSFYTLAVTYNGKTCNSATMVKDSCLLSCSIRKIPVDDCNGYASSGGQVTLIGSSDIPDALYSWSPQTGLSAYIGNVVHLTDTVSRTYTMTVVSAHNSGLTCTASITTNLLLESPVFSAPDTLTCADVPVTIGAAAQPGYSYQWTGSGLSANNISNPVATVSETSSFYVTVTSSNGCTVKDTVVVTVPIEPANAGADKIVCDNAIVTLGTDSLPNTTYSWDPPAAPWQNGTDQFFANPQVLSAVTVTYTLTTNMGGCTSTDDVTITVNNFPTIPDAPDRSICLGSNTTIGSQPLPGVTYQWSPTTGLADPTASTTLANPESTTTYMLTATFPGNCTVPATDVVTVTVRDLSFSMPDIEYCPQSGAVQLGAGVPAGLSYYWQPENLVSNPRIRNPQTVNPPPGSITNLILTVVNGGCYLNDTLQLIPFMEQPVVSDDRTTCINQAVRIGSDSNATGGSISYQWSPTDNLDDPNSPNPLFTGLNVGTYQYVLTKTNSTIPCSNSDTVMLTVVDILPGLNSVSLCKNSCAQIGTAPINNISYSWMPETGLSDPASSQPIACIDSNSVAYMLTVSDNKGCTVTDTVVVSVMDAPGINVSIPNVVACRGEQNVMFAPSMPAGSYSWMWQPDDNTLSNIYALNPVIQTAVAGIKQYSFEVTDNISGCTQTFPVIATINECPLYGSAGNFVWIDLNENGIQDTFEPGAGEVSVRLYNNIGFLVATTVTDLTGNYQFENIVPGSGYYIVFEAPLGYRFTLPHIGGRNAVNNSKADVAGKTNNFNLLSGNVITNMDAGLVPEGVVPVSLLNFRARLHDKEAYLNWQTAYENNCEFFYVERSSDALTFSSIGRVNGHGTTSAVQQYRFIDNAPVEGDNFYRLKQTDFDGRFNYSHVEMVRLTKDEIFTAIYNSTSNSVHVRFNKDRSDVALKMFAPNGQLIASRNVRGAATDFELPLPFLSTGIYFLQLHADGVVRSKKIYVTR